MALYPENMTVPSYCSTEEFFIIPIDSYPDYVEFKNPFVYNVKYFEAFNSYDPDEIVDGDDYVVWGYFNRDHKDRKAFYFIILEQMTNEVLGGVNIGRARLNHAPLTNNKEENASNEFEAVISFWVLKSDQMDYLEKRLLETLIDWFKHEWVFTRVYFCRDGSLKYRADRKRQSKIFTDVGLELKYTDQWGDSVYGE